METIKIKITKNGKRKAYRFSVAAQRSFPMPIAEADMLIASGQAVVTSKFFYEN